MALKLVGLKPLGRVGGFVPNDAFEEHERRFPQVCIDIVVVHGRSFLLVRRSSKNSTARGSWATAGGRVRKNETLEDSAIRILDRETGIKADKHQFDFVGVNQYFDRRVHCVSIVFKTKARSRSVVLDDTSSEFGWFTRESCPPSLIPYYRNMLRLGGLNLGPEGWSED